MKKIMLSLSVFFILTAVYSCAAPEKSEEISKETAVISADADAAIKVFRTKDLTGPSLSVLKPGINVTILRNFCPGAALIQIPEGKTGWIDCRYLQ
ncbi:MAG: hypothetical protein ACLFP1_04100 [Candidatus Goldiibacteriota bacterium]